MYVVFSLWQYLFLAVMALDLSENSIEFLWYFYEVFVKYCIKMHACCIMFLYKNKYMPYLNILS